MANLKRTSTFMLSVLALPLLVGCGKARYEKVPGRSGDGSAFRRLPESHGQMDVRNQAPPVAVPNNNGRETRPEPPPTTGPAPAPVPEPQRPSRPAPHVDCENEACTPPPPKQPETYPDLPPPESREVPWQNPLDVKRPQEPRPPQAPAAQCFEGEYRQAEGPATNKVDILFVTDTSASLDKERAEIASGIDQFVSALPRGTDYNIGVVYAHSDTTGLAGELVSADGEPTVLPSSTMDLNTIRRHLYAKLTRVRGDRGSDGGELGLYSLEKAVTEPKLTKNLNQQFFRTDAGLVVIFVADENDICSYGHYPSGVTPAADPNEDEIPAFRKYCEGRVTPESVYASLRRLKAGYSNPATGQTETKPLIVSGILYTDASTVPTQDASDKWHMENEVGYGYIDVIRMGNGVAVDLAAGRLGQGLRQIGLATAQKLALKTEFRLNPADADPETICALVDGRDAPFVFNETLGEIQLEQAGAPGSRLEFFWCSKGEVDGEGQVLKPQPELNRIKIDPRCVSLLRRAGRGGQTSQPPRPPRTQQPPAPRPQAPPSAPAPPRLPPPPRPGK